MTEIVTIPLSKLAVSDANMRRTAREAGLEELAASIAAHGLLQNLTVRPLPDGAGPAAGRYEVVAGGRRLAAAGGYLDGAQPGPIAVHSMSGPSIAIPRSPTSSRRSGWRPGCSTAFATTRGDAGLVLRGRTVRP